ncbi:hypothetical protein [Agrobacterium sp. NPDC090283]|uniref:hypothetical protein n=1 Tax=Agrobacterium sp. NPDC090283 TaxID=3363920 RepID=UPI00383B9FC3
MHDFSGARYFALHLAGGAATPISMNDKGDVDRLCKPMFRPALTISPEFLQSHQGCLAVSCHERSVPPRIDAMVRPGNTRRDRPAFSISPTDKKPASAFRASEHA